MPTTPDLVLEALRSVIDPDLGRDIVTLGFVQNVVVDGEAVSFTVELTTPACPVREELKAQSEEAVLALDGVSEVSIELTARVRERQVPSVDILPGVRHVIAIASGKGGVGKSTVTANLAVALVATGAKVGLMDADVYGPSIPLMLGCAQERPFTRNAKIEPIERFGLKLMSLGFLLEEGQAVLWRGPMVAGTVRQLITDVDWGELDYLLVDLPPGTGDAPMSLAQLAPLTGVVIVTTPHNVAANIAGKAASLFRRLNAPILGVVENMAEFVCPECGATSRVFSGMSGRELSNVIEAPFLGSVPLDPVVSDAGNAGTPSLLFAPDRPQAAAFHEIAGRLAQQASIMAFEAPAEPAVPTGV